MLMMTRQRLLLLAAVSLAGCHLDTDLPNPPTSGSVSGSVDFSSGKVATTSGFEVRLGAEDGSFLSATTSGDGAFVFGSVPPGLYFLSIDIPSFAPFVRPNVRVLNGQKVALDPIRLVSLVGTPAESSVSGKVTVPRGGISVGGRVDFILDSLGSRIASAPLDENGEFIARVPPGTYTLKASHPLYVSATLTSVTVPEGSVVDVSSQPLVLGVNPATLTGQLTRERDPQAPDNAAGATVTLDTGDTTTTDVDGKFVLTGLPGGSHTVRFVLAGWHDTVASHPVDLGGGTSTALSPVQLAIDRGDVSGVVTTGDLQLARDVTVSLTGTTRSIIAVPDAANPARAAFQLRGVPVGTYELVATKQGYQPAKVGAVTVTFNQVADVGTLTLVVQTGAFDIDDGDSTNTPGYARQRAVTLQLVTTTAAKFRASEDSAFTGVAFTALTGSSQPFTLSTGDGTKTVYVQFQDSSGVAGPVLQSRIVYDTTPPSSPSLLINGGAAFTNVAQPLSLTLSAVDLPASGADVASGLARVRVTDGSATDAGVLVAPLKPYQRDLSFTRPTLGEGVQAVSVQFFDHAGNPSAVVSGAITIDTTPPSGAITIARGPNATLDGYTNQPLVDLSTATGAEPDGGYVMIKLANSQTELNTAVFQPVRAVTGWFLDSAADGSKSVLAMLRDAAGNTSGNLTATIVYDTRPPSPVSLTLSSPAVTNDAGVLLMVSATDSNPFAPDAGLTLSEDPLFLGATLGPQALPAVLPAPVAFTVSAADGPKRIFARYRDAAGNDATAEATVTLDTTPPTGSIALRGKLADGTPSSATTFTASVDVLITQSGATDYAIGNEGLTACAGATYQALPAGGAVTAYPLSGAVSPREVHVCLRDAAGNLTGPLVSTIALDTTTPTGCKLTLTGARADGLAAPLPAGKTGSVFVTAQISTCSETPVDLFLSTTPVTCSATASVDWKPFSSTNAVTLTGGDGLNTVYGCVRDAAHNTGALATDSLTLDTTPPRVTAFVLNGGAAWFNAASYQAAASQYDVSALGTATGASEWAVSETGTFGTFFAYPAFNPFSVRLSGTAGTHTVSALFRDDVGNEATIVSSSIVVDVQAPAGGTLALVSPTANGFTNSVSVTATLVAPSDAVAVQLASAAGANCALSDFSGAISRAMSPTFTFLLPAGDGTKAVCARLFDAAGNGGGLLQASIVLDTTPPTAPQVVTPSQFVNSANATAFVVTTVGPVTEANFDHYQRLGGLTSSGAVLDTWVNDAAAIGTTGFTFSLQASASVEQTVNVLRVRARDLAGNVSPEASVVVTDDIKPPSPVTLNSLWVRNSSERGTVYWQKSVSTDVVGYNVYYANSTQAASGYALAGYTGTTALQGSSPVRVGDVGSVGLSGLSNGSALYVTVRPVDRAGNEGPAPAYPMEVSLQPNAVSLDTLGNVTTAVSNIERIAVSGNYAYLWGTNSSGTATMLQPIDLSVIGWPVDYGSLTATPPMPTALAAQSFADNPAGYTYAWGYGVDMVVDGQYLFATSGTKVRVFSLKTPRTPVLAATIDVSAQSTAAFSVAVKGPTLFIGGRAVDQHALLIAVDLSKLYDNNAATSPSIADLIGVAQGAWSDATDSVTLTREFAVTSTLLGGNAVCYAITDAIDGNAATVFGNADYIPSSMPPDPFYGTISTRPVASGNYLVGLSWQTTGLFDVSRLWNGTSPKLTSVATMTGGGNAQFDVKGTQIFLADGTVLGAHVYDFGALPAVADQGVYRFPSGSAPNAVAIYGNHLLAATGGVLSVLEVARPTGLHVVSSAALGTPQAELAPGLLYSTDGQVLDLTAGSPPTALSGGSGVCSIDAARVGDVLVSGYNTYRVMNMENAIDRDLTTPWGAADVTVVAAPMTLRVTGLDAVGHMVVATEVRTSGTPGVWLRVMDGRKLLRKATYASWSPFTTDSVGELNLSTYSSTTAVAHLSMYEGRALVTLEDPFTPLTGSTFFVVDLRPLLDDDAATTFTSPVNPIQAQLALGNVFPGVIRGDYAYVGSQAGLRVVEIPEAMDESPTTVVPSTARTALLSLPGGAESVTAYGGYAFATPTYGAQQGKGLQVIDVRAPLSPQVLSFLPMTGPNNNCYARSGITVAGSRAYVSGFYQTTIVELE